MKVRLRSVALGLWALMVIVTLFVTGVTFLGQALDQHPLQLMLFLVSAAALGQMLGLGKALDRLVAKYRGKSAEKVSET